MEIKEFDATLGGNENLPYSANSLRFASSRSIEIAAMTESILRPSKTKLIFQTLPVHMRRRVMSHNAKRLPRKLREGHLEQLKKSGSPPKQKRPSRKYRRRPANLLGEYNRRQRCNVWLETHIWHAKRFHMIERWGHRLALAPCDKAFRACYRATSANCLLQDISYYTSVCISGSVKSIINFFSTISSSSCGLGIGARAYVRGNREGSLHLFRPNTYPFSYIAKISFIWVHHIGESNLWLFVHPSQAKEVESVFISETVFSEIIGSGLNEFPDIPIKRTKLNENLPEKIQYKFLPGSFNKFRLTGPKSHAILVNALKCVNNLEKVSEEKWVSSHYCGKVSSFKLEEKYNYWSDISKASSPSQLPPSLILGLIVKDPRTSRPAKRTKAKQVEFEDINIAQIINIPQYASFSPIWNTNIHEDIKDKILTNGQYIEHVTRTQLVPGEVYENDPLLQSIPIVLIQRPGSQNSRFKKLGFGCGWDIILPAGYGIQFWQTLVMFGARTGGLRETESLAFEMGESYLPPDSEAGKTENSRREAEMKDKYFKQPPSKRVNYIKLGINSPFLCQWNILLKDWCNKEVNNFFVLRDKLLLQKLQDCLDRKSQLPVVENQESCLVPMYLQIIKKGSITRHALICLPKSGDNPKTDNLLEAQHVDLNLKFRKEMRLKRNKIIKQLRRKNIKMKKKGVTVKKTKLAKQAKKEPSDYVKKMRELWLPSNITNVRHLCSREVMGYLSQGAFSFSEAKSCGVGYLAYNSLTELLKNGFNYVLVRNTTSLKYRMANIQIM